MSPTNKKKLNQIRIKLDKLDNDLLKLIKKRSSLVNEVLKVKIHKIMCFHFYIELNYIILN